ncbi:fkbM_fam, methyltransferase, FkbM family [uncultured Caudovirales phage]|uniref:FkbM_fam, methyltransferase, FkbM family n=1 Tax=uncultured Caudovirales phage TaxID=2100421 RepID=A0A6J5NQD0_9CAUD|nr:fkbM_fam, methyltransferase, FkbM family [uncultured Caudovirales phage]
MDTRIDFNTAKKFNQIDLIDWPTKYGNFKFYIRKGLNEIKYNVGTNVSKSPKSGEYIKPLTSSAYGPSLDVNAVFNQNDVWLDVGGHIGLFAVRMATQFPKIQKIYAYEALPHNASFAIENIAINNVTAECEVVQKAIVPTNEDTIDFFISNDSGKHSILPIRGRDVMHLPAININDAIANHGATAIKMDVEGAEYELIKAVTDWSKIRVLIVEYHFMYKLLKTNRVQKFQEIISILENNFDIVRKIEAVEYGKNFITHIVAIKNDKSN